MSGLVFGALANSDVTRNQYDTIDNTPRIGGPTANQSLRCYHLGLSVKPQLFL